MMLAQMPLFINPSASGAVKLEQIVSMIIFFPFLKQIIVKVSKGNILLATDKRPLSKK